MELPKIGSREEWLAIRLELLAKEKELSRAQAALAAERQALPMVEITKDYIFTGPGGPVKLADLQPQLGSRCAARVPLDP